jgi:hypothetical protein
MGLFEEAPTVPHGVPFELGKFSVKPPATDRTKQNRWLCGVSHDELFAAGSVILGKVAGKIADFISMCRKSDRGCSFSSIAPPQNYLSRVSKGPLRRLFWQFGCHRGFGTPIAVNFCQRKASKLWKPSFSPIPLHH